MKNPGHTLRVTRAALALAALIPATLPAAAGPAAGYRVTHADLAVICPMTVGGSFEAKTTALTGEVKVNPDRPGELLGELRVDLRTLDTGIALRNRHLQENYLEVPKGDGFDTAVLSAIRVEGADLRSFHGKAPFHATFLLHGVKKDVTGEADVRGDGDAIAVEASFPVVVSDHQIKKPTYLGVGVKNEVRVKVVLGVAALAGDHS